MKIVYSKGYTWKSLNLSFLSALHRSFLKNTDKFYLPSSAAKEWIFRSNYSLTTIFLPLRCFERDMGTMWRVKLVTTNLAISKPDYNPGFSPTGARALQLLCWSPKVMPKSITVTVPMLCSKEWLKF